MEWEKGSSQRDRSEVIEAVASLHRSGIIQALAVLGSEKSAEKPSRNVLAVWQECPDGVKAHRIELDNAELFILSVSQEFFEKDVREALLGELAASWLLARYSGLVGPEYLQGNEVLFKRKKVAEALTGVVIEYGDLSTEIMIEPRYFLSENLRRITRVYPPLSSIYADLIEGDEEATQSSLRGYQDAVGKLVNEGVIHVSGDYLILDHGFIENTRKQRFRAISFLKMIDRTLGPYLLKRLRKAGTLLNLYMEMTAYYGKGGTDSEITTAAGDPRRFLHLPTTLGTVSLSNEAGIEDFMAHEQPFGKITSTKLQRCGGVLNDVYILSFKRDGKEEKALVKKYQNLVGLKWFPLALWTLGTQNFSVLGRTRLSREYSISSLLYRHGIHAPRNHHVDLNRLLLIREFIEGRNQISTVKSCLSKKECSHEISRLRTLGQLIANVHARGVTIGDCKPENFIEDPGGAIYVIDLEQGAHKGNRAWDLAELLYYSGHYASILTSLDRVSDVTRAIVGGYLDGKGDTDVVEEVGGLRYTKVFSLFTLPQVIYTISKTCREEAVS